MSCPNKCVNGYIKRMNEELGCEEYVLCSCKRDSIDNKVFKLKLEQTGIPKYFWDKDIESYENKFSSLPKNRNRDELVTLIRQPDKFQKLSTNLWIYGNNSNEYKTSLAIELGKEITRKQDIKYVKFIQFRKLMDLFLDFEKKRDLIHNLMLAKVIIIDDMFDLTRASLKEYQSISLYGFIEDVLGNNIRLCCTAKDKAESYIDSILFKETAKLISYSNLISLNFGVN